MAEVDRLVDSLALFLMGGASNTDPDLSIGGVPSTARVRGLGVLVSDPIPAIRIDNVHPACGEGEASLALDAAGELTFTPPGATAGAAVVIAEGESKILTGADTSKAIRVTRIADYEYPIGSVMSLTFVNALNGVLGQTNLSSAQRAAGRTTYRSLALRAVGVEGVIDIRLWTPAVFAAQAVFSLAVEDPVAGAIQTVADEETPPIGMTWATPITEGAALVIPAINPGSFKGLWIRRVFPSGIVTPREDVQLAIKYRGA